MASNTESLPVRSDIPEAYTWDTLSVFPSDEAWLESIDRAEREIEDLATFEGRLGDGPDVLASFLERRFEVGNLVRRIYVYASGFRSVDTADQEAAARTSRAGSLYALLAARLSFAEPELREVGFETLDAWSKEHQPLARYRHYFERLADRAEHLRSGDVESVVAQLGDPLGTATRTARILTDSEIRFDAAIDADGNEHEVAQGTIGDLTTRADRTLRRKAWQSYADGHLRYKQTLANSLSVAIKRDVTDARIHRYDTALEAALGREQLPVAVFDATIRAFRDHLPTWHRYWRLRREVLGIDVLHPWDLKAPLSKDKPTVSYERASQWIQDGMAPLGADYVEPMRRGIEQERWIDVYPNRGKTAGAFSSGAQGTHPFILMSYTDDLFSLSTLAHELGHSMHSYLTWQTQPPVYSSYSMFVAEVASNFNQALVRHHLFETEQDPKLQLALIEELLSNFHRYLFIMPTLARFEREIHEQEERGEPLTADGMIDRMAELFGEGFGGEVEFDRDRVGITWAQFGHLYANFYVFQYATGIAAAHALAEPVLAGDSDAVERYLGFLRAGGSKYALDALRDAGVDMTSPEPMAAAFGMLSDALDRLETLVGLDGDAS